MLKAFQSSAFSPRVNSVKCFFKLAEKVDSSGLALGAVPPEATAKNLLPAGQNASARLKTTCANITSTRPSWMHRVNAKGNVQRTSAWVHGPL